MSFAPDPPEALSLSADDLAKVLSMALPAVLEQQHGLLAVKDSGSGRYVHVSAAMAAFLAQPAAAVVGRSDADLFDAALARALRAAEQTALAHGSPLLSDHHFEWQGARREFSVLRICTAAAAGSPPWVTSIWLDQTAERLRERQLRGALEQIEQQQHANDRLRREIADQALRDPASGLHRRAHFEDQLRREVDLSMREHREFAIVFIELDAPSPKVLALGAVGEQAVLEAMGRLLRSGTRAMDASCRFDERRFAVLLSGVGLATAHSRMEGLRRKCATQIVVHGGQELGFTVSVGLASVPHTASSQESLIEAREAALAEAMRRGGTHVTLAAICFEGA